MPHRPLSYYNKDGHGHSHTHSHHNDENDHEHEHDYEHHEHGEHELRVSTDDDVHVNEHKSLISPRTAHRTGNVSASKHYHSTKDSTAESKKESEAHTTYAEYIKSIVYGGLDGIITTFATVTSVAGANLSPLIVVVLGISHLLADGLSMGAGDCMSSQAEIDLNKAERKRERWEMENNFSGEIDEMVELYCNKGVDGEDAKTIICTMAKYPKLFLDHMMVEELGIPPPGPGSLSPVKAGFITMCSFMLFGAVPLMPYLLALIPGLSKIFTPNVQLYSAVAITVLTLFVLGAFKGRISGSKGGSWWSGFQMALNGSFAAIVGFAVGWGLGKLVHVDEQALPPGAG